MSVRLTSEIATKSRQANGQGVEVGHGIPLRLGGMAFRAMAKMAIPPNLRGIPDPTLTLLPLTWRDLVAISLVNRTDILITSLLLKETCYQNVGSVDK